MRRPFTDCKLYGFEDYMIINIPSGGFNPNPPQWISLYSYYDRPGYYLLKDNMHVQLDKGMYDTYFLPEHFCEDHKELLADAKKIYVHPACTLSRTMLTSKYKKSTNPWMADVVVTPNIGGNHIDYNEGAIFINEEAKKMYKVTAGDIAVLNYLGSLPMGIKVNDAINSKMKQSEDTRFNYTNTDLMNAELMYYGPIFYISQKESFIFDILTNNIPTDKIVFENTIQESLGDESNKITLESILSIYDMLESSDSDTVAAGLKSLSMMDWMHYPNSIKYMYNQLNYPSRVYYNKAFSSTSVKFMFKNINNGRKFNWIRYDTSITQEDYELFRQLIAHFDKYYGDDVDNRLKEMCFMKVSQGVLVPNIKQST